MRDTTDRPNAIKNWLGRRSATASIIALAMVLMATCLWAGLSADDYMQAIVLLGLPLPRAMKGPLDLFRFADGDPATFRALADIGQFPWAADPHTRFAFFRPLAAATHVLDYALWPRSSACMHAQSMLWFALALVGLAAVYRRFIGVRWVAGLALLIYAVDDTHGPTVNWLANRNSLIALTLAIPVLLLHDRWRRAGSRRAVVLGVPLLAVALLAGESALAIVAYLFAYEVHLDEAPWRSRLEALLPYGGVLVVWRIAYAKLGYGVSGSGLYLDPGAQPLQFLAAMPKRYPFLLLGELGLPRSDAGPAYDYMGTFALPWMVAYALVALGLIGAAMFRLVRRDPVARFFATGMLLSAVPICAAFASDRLLLFVGIGAIGLIAKLVASAVSFGERLAAAYLLFVHLVVAPPFLMLRSRYNDYQLWIDIGDDTIPKTPEIASKTVVIVNPPNDLFYVYLPVVRAVRGEPRPARLRGLANVVDGMQVTRIDATSLRIRPDRGFLKHEIERMMTDPRKPFRAGEEVEIPGMRVTISESTPDGFPTEAVFRFDTPLEEDSFAWFAWGKKGYEPWRPPAVGESTRVPAHDFRAFVLDVEDRVKGR